MKKLFALFIIFILDSIPIRAEVEAFYLGNIKDIKDKEIKLIGLNSRLGGRNQEALEFFDKLLKAKPDNAEAYFQRGRSLEFLERYPEAIASFDQAIKYKRTPLDEVYYYRGGNYDVLDKLSEALSDYEKAIELGFDHRSVYFCRNEIRMKLGLPL